MTIETRPDFCLTPHLAQMLSYGCTRLEIGLQSTYEDVARDTNRGHTVAAVGECFHLAKDAGFKVGGMWCGVCVLCVRAGGWGQGVVPLAWRSALSRLSGPRTPRACSRAFPPPSPLLAWRTARPSNTLWARLVLPVSLSPTLRIHAHPHSPQVIAHMMPDLPNVGWERDIESFREFFENPAFRSDGLKLYPTLVIRGTGLYELWKRGLYKNYAPDKVGTGCGRAAGGWRVCTRVWRATHTGLLPVPLRPPGGAGFGVGHPAMPACPCHRLPAHRPHPRHHPPALQLVDLVARILAYVPPWVRIYRIQRDIPMPLVSSGVEKGNLRELALARMGALGLKCRDVRTREAGIQDIHHKARRGQRGVAGLGLAVVVAGAWSVRDGLFA